MSHTGVLARPLGELVSAGRHAIKPADERYELLRRRPVRGVRGKVEEGDLAIPIDDDVGAELELVVRRLPPDALAGNERPQTRRDDTGA